MLAKRTGTPADFQREADCCHLIVAKTASRERGLVLWQLAQTFRLAPTPANVIKPEIRLRAGVRLRLFIISFAMAS
jgi:hypothetical protein